MRITASSEVALVYRVDSGTRNIFLLYVARKNDTRGKDMMGRLTSSGDLQRAEGRENM